MTPVDSYLQAALAAFAPPNQPRALELVEQAWALAVERLKTLRLEPYAVAVGHGTEVRLRATARGFRRSLVPDMMQVQKWSPDWLLCQIMEAMAVKEPWMTFQWHYLCEVFVEVPANSPDVVARIGALLAEALAKPVDLGQAQEQKAKNMEHSEVHRHRIRLEKLANQMRGHDFTREEVIEAWEMSEVHRVQQS